MPMVCRALSELACQRLVRQGLRAYETKRHRLGPGDCARFARVRRCQQPGGPERR